MTDPERSDGILRVKIDLGGSDPELIRRIKRRARMSTTSGEAPDMGQRAAEQEPAREPARLTELIAANVRRIRAERKLTYVALAARLTELGSPIPVLGLRRIENHERRMDVTELLALSYALDVAPVDLLVPNTMGTNDRYPIAPTAAATVDAETAREWVRGERPLTTITGDATATFRYISAMPADRAERVLKETMER